MNDKFLIGLHTTVRFKKKEEEEEKESSSKVGAGLIQLDFIPRFLMEGLSWSAGFTLLVRLSPSEPMVQSKLSSRLWWFPDG